MVINIYPSQDNSTNQTLWILSGSSTVRNNSSAGRRTSSSSSNANLEDTWWFGSPNNGNFYDANKPTDTNFQLSPLFSSSNTNDIASVRARIPGGGRSNITFAASTTNTPTITITGRGSRTIASLYLNEDPGDEDDMGIRVSGSNFSYSSSTSSASVGSGIINKPIGDFFTGTFSNNENLSPRFASSSSVVRIVVNSQIIPRTKRIRACVWLVCAGLCPLSPPPPKETATSHHFVDLVWC